MKITDIFRLAGSNIIRSRAFFYANVLAIGIGIMLIVVLLSLARGIWNFTEETMRAETSALAIEVLPGPDQAEGLFPVADISNIRQVPGVTNVVPTIQGVFAELSHNKATTTVSVWSTTGRDDPELNRLTWVPNTPTPETLDGDYIVLPASILAEMQVTDFTSAVGATVQLVFTRKRDDFEEVRELTARIGGIARNTRYSRCYIPLETMDNIWAWQNGLDKPGYPSVMVYATTVGDVESIRQSLEDEGLRTISILDTVRRYKEILMIISVVLGTLGGISLLSGSMSIFSATYASVLRRTREFGIYKSFGASPANVLILVMSELFMTALLAGFLGFLGGVIAADVIQNVFLDNLGREMFVIDGLLFGFAAGLAVLVCLLAGIGPAFKAARSSPVSAVRNG